MHGSHAIISIALQCSKHYLNIKKEQEHNIKTPKENIMFLLENVRRWNKNRTDMNHLYAMSNRELSDIGISRSEIKAIVRKGQR